MERGYTIWKRLYRGDRSIEVKLIHSSSALYEVSMYAIIVFFITTVYFQFIKRQHKTESSYWV